MGKKAEDLKAGDKVKLGGHKVKIEKVRDEGDSVNVTWRGRGSRGQESFGRNERVE